jgi:hypothetical protein
MTSMITACNCVAMSKPEYVEADGALKVDSHGLLEPLLFITSGSSGRLADSTRFRGSHIYVLGLIQ